MRDPDALRQDIEQTLLEADRLLAKMYAMSGTTPKRGKLVVIEDDKMVLQGLRNMFEDQFEISCFEDGHSGLRALVTESADVAILDMQLPDISGFDLLRRVKAMNPHLPVIVHTGFPGDYPEREIRDLGLAGYVEKGHPDSYDFLLDIAESAVDTYHSLKREIVRKMVQCFENTAACSYSAVFNQVTGVVLSVFERNEISVQDVATSEELLPLCYLSNDLSHIRDEEGVRICPFLGDIDPISDPAKYDIGVLASYECLFYRAAQTGSIDERLISSLRAKLEQDCD